MSDKLPTTGKVWELRKWWQQEGGKSYDAGTSVVLPEDAKKKLEAFLEGIARDLGKVRFIVPVPPPLDVIAQFVVGIGWADLFYSCGEWMYEDGLKEPFDPSVARKVYIVSWEETGGGSAKLWDGKKTLKELAEEVPPVFLDEDEEWTPPEGKNVGEAPDFGPQTRVIEWLTDDDNVCGWALVEMPPSRFIDFYGPTDVVRTALTAYITVEE